MRAHHTFRLLQVAYLCIVLEREEKRSRRGNCIGKEEEQKGELYRQRDT